MAAVEEQLRGQETSLPCSGLSEGTGSSSNTPEETDDVDNSSFDASYSMRAAPWAGTASLPPLTVDEEGMLLAGGAVEADSSAEACAFPARKSISKNRPFIRGIYYRSTSIFLASVGCVLG